MRACHRCEGFVPVGLSSCPNCDAQLDAASAPSRMRLRDTLAMSVMASGAAMTLMACYGLPPCDDSGAGDCYDFSSDSGSGTGGLEETCDPASSVIGLLSPLPVTQAGALVNAPDTNIGSCGGAGDEVVYTWTAPAAGSYRFSVESADFDVVLYVRDGSPELCGQELGCVLGDPASTNTELILNLAGTDTVTVVVDSASPGAGAFTLTIEAQ